VEFNFKNQLWYWRGPSPFHFISIPANETSQIKGIASSVTYGWGAIPVQVRIGKSDFTTSIFPKDGLYIVPIKNAIRFSEGLKIDDLVHVKLKLGKPA